MICVLDLPTLCGVVAAMLLITSSGLRVRAPHVDGSFDGLYVKEIAAKIMQSVLKSLDQDNRSLIIGIQRVDKQSPLLIIDGKWLDFWIEDFSLFFKTSKGYSKGLLVYVPKRLIVLDDSHNRRECLCIILFSQRIKPEVSDLHCLTHMLDLFFANYWFLLACFYSTKFDDMACFRRSRHEFQWHNEQFKKMEITLDHCYFSLVYLCPAKMFQASSVLQKKKILDGCISQTVSLVFNFLPRLLSTHVMQHGSSFGRVLLLHTSCIQSIHPEEGASICVSNELISLNTTWTLHGFFLLTLRLNANGDGDFARQWDVFNVGCEGFFQGQRGDCFFPCHSDNLENYFSPLQSSFDPYIGVYMSLVMALRIVSHSGGLHTIVCFFYGSLPRAPEINFQFYTSLFTYRYHAHGVDMSKMEYFHLEGEY